MCLTMPGRVIAVEPDFAVVEEAGRRRRATTLLAPDLRIGDWVLVAGGTVVRCLDADQAEAMASAFEIATDTSWPARVHAGHRPDPGPQPHDPQNRGHYRRTDP